MRSGTRRTELDNSCTSPLPNPTDSKITKMIRCFSLGFILFLVAASLAHGAADPGALFRGVVVPLSAAGKPKGFAHSSEDRFNVRLRVTEILAGGAPAEKGKDYVFNIHSIVGTFGCESLKEVEGQEFIWYLRISLANDDTPVAHLYRGESLYEDFKKQKEDDRSAPARSP